VSRFDDDGRSPTDRVSSGRPPGERAPSPRRKAPTRRETPPSGTRGDARRPQPTTPARTATRQRRRNGENSEEFWGRHFEDDEEGPPTAEAELPRSQRMAQRGVEHDRRRRRRRTIIVLAIVLLPILLLLAAGGWFLYQLNPPGDPGRKITVTVPKDTGTDGIGDLLEDKGVIGSSTAFQIFTKVTRAGPFKPGKYSMREDLGVRDAVSTLKSGPVKAAEAKLALPPGLTLEQIADRVGQLPGHSKEGFLAAAQSGAVRSKYQPAEVTSLEGLMFPDTYIVTKKETDQQLLSRLVAAFDAQADAVGLSNPNASGLSPYQTIIAASLIEREAKLDQDRPLIAAVIRNRLRAGMALQIDATVCYAKGGCDKAPTKADLEIDSPYNTYKVQGLPPTPISGVSAQSLMAAANPADAPYLYYVLIDENGKHAFATTQEEHDKNVEEARQKGLL
jgi:UPF0755 protein